MFNYKNKIKVLTLIIVSVTMMSFINTPKKEKTDNETIIYKNLKVLPKNITKEDLDAVMDNYCLALNVKCGYCHIKTEEKWDFISDNKEEKIIARKMQTMTNEINKKYFGENSGTIGCMTCHNGKINPNDMH